MDKHRQAAVLTGERDVKTDVRIKKKRDRYLFFSRALYNHGDFIEVHLLILDINTH